MPARVIALTMLMTAVACGGGEKSSPPAPPPPAEPIRSAAGDQDLRVMLAELAEGRGCDLLKGQFRALRDKARPQLVIGMLWMRDCEVRRHGTNLTLELSTNGWQRVEKKQEKAGATFDVSQDVRFAANVTIPGKFDVAYDPKTHVASMWFSPTKSPQVKFRPIQEIEVEEEGAWSETVGALVTLVGQSPENQAEDQAKNEGKQDMASELSHGLGATTDLCTGLVRFDLGRPGKGKMYPAGIGESKKIENEVHPTGMLLYGPYPAPKGMHATFEVTEGTVRAALMCRGEAEKLATAFVDGVELPDVKPLAVKDIGGEGALVIGKSRCQVTLVVRAIPDGKGVPARFTWTRSTKEWAEATGGAKIKCDERR